VKDPAISPETGEQRQFTPTQYFKPATWISDDVTTVILKYGKSVLEPAFRVASCQLWVADRAGNADFHDRGVLAMLPLRDVLTKLPPLAGAYGEKLAWMSNWPVAPAVTRQNEELGRVCYIVGRGADANSPWLWDIWHSESILFVRWALDDPTHQRSRAMWRYADRASRGDSSETAFIQCFGFGFSEAERRIYAYLGKALGKASPAWAPEAQHLDFSLGGDKAADLPYVNLRDATASEVGRVLGDWQRKEIEYVKLRYPDFVGEYAAQAERTLLTAYQDGAQDSDLLAAIGLFYSTTDSDSAAIGFLTRAVEGHTERPMAYVALARIRFESALASPRGRHGRLDRAQVDSVLALVRAASTLEPPQRKAYLLAAAAWEHADFIPSPGELKLLARGAEYFPFDSTLIIAAAQLDAAAGRADEAIRLIRRCLERDVDDTSRATFAELLALYLRRSAPTGH
jgi:hypothetical protein